MKAAALRLLAAGAVANLLPSTAAIRTLRVHALSGLSGVGAPDHVALTFDDGPHPEGTPRIAARLAELGLQATFFVVGDALLHRPHLGRELAEAGHELALHGFHHRAQALQGPLAAAADVRRGHRTVRTITGAAPRFWRPPHGIPTVGGLLAARQLGMRPVLWTADGHDWRTDATAGSAADRLRHQLRGGGVVLLHDGLDGGRVAGWRVAMAVLPMLAEWCAAQGWRLGPLRDHELTPVGSRPCG